MSHAYTKMAAATIKAVAPTDPNTLNTTGLAAGQFKALVSVFNNVDSYGDVVMPGAFADVLAEARATGQRIPVVWSHDWGDVYSHIGWAEPSDVVETPDGLEVTATLDVASPVTPAAERAQQVHRLLESGRVGQFSFAFDIADAGWGVRGDGDDTQDVFEIRKFAALHEVGPCLVGVNQATRLEAVKALHAAYPKAAPPTVEDGPADPPSAPTGLDPTSVALLADIYQAS